MPFITRPADAKGNPAPHSFDFHDIKSPPRSAIEPERCHCPLHLGDTDYWKRFTKPKEKQRQRTTRSMVKSYKSTPPSSTKSPTMPLRNPATSPSRSPILKRTANDIEPKEPIIKRFKNINTFLSPTSRLLTSEPTTASPSSSGMSHSGDLQWHSDMDVMMWATHTTAKYGRSLKPGLTTEQQEKLYKRMVDMMTLVFTNTRPSPWSSFQSVINHALTVVNLVEANPSQYSMDALVLWMLSAVNIVQLYADTLAPSDTTDVQRFINILITQPIDKTVLTSIISSLMKIMEDNMFHI